MLRDEPCHKGIGFLRCGGELGRDSRRGISRDRTFRADEEERDGSVLGFGNGMCQEADSKRAGIEREVARRSS